MGGWDPDTAAARMQDLERRVSALERAPRLTSSSLTDGTLTITDAAGNPMVHLGLLPGGAYGLAVMTATGRVLAQTDSVSGQLAPVQYLPAGVARSERSFNGGPALTELFRFDFYSTGPDLGYDLQLDFSGFTSADVSILAVERGVATGSAVGATGVLTSAVDLVGLAAGQYVGVAAIPPGALIAGTGADARGRHMSARIRVRGNGGAAPGSDWVDLRLNGPVNNRP